MGTRAVIRLQDEENNDFIWIYRQYDGYPECTGVQLFDFFQDETLGETEEIAMRLIAYLKTVNSISKNLPPFKDWGNFRLYIPENNICSNEAILKHFGAEYVYTIAKVSQKNQYKITMYSIYNEQVNLTKEYIEKYKLKFSGDST